MGNRVVVVSAPARIDLAGGFTDGVYPDIYGKVCNFAINRRSTVEISPWDSTRGVLVQRTDPCEFVTLVPDLIYGQWYDLFLAAVKRYQLDGLKIKAYSDIPWGSGLGGSGSTAVALVTALSQLEVPPSKLAGLDLSSDSDRVFIAQEARALEKEEMNNSTGWQDQWAAVFGGISFLEAKNDPQTPHRIFWQPGKEEIIEIENHLLLIKTPSDGPRSSSDIQTQEVDTSVLPNMVKDAERAFSYFQDRRFGPLGEVLSDTWRSICQLTLGRAQSSAIAALIARCFFHYEGLVYGWKGCGSGGEGACVVVVLEPSARSQLITELIEDPDCEGYEILPFSLDFEGVRVQILTS